MQARLRTSYGAETVSTAVQNQMNGFINRAIEQVARIADTAVWLRRHFSFITTPQLVSTTAANGVTAAVGGSPIMTLGSELRLDRRHIGAYLRISGEQETYLIKEVTRDTSGTGTTTVIAVDPPYAGAVFGTTNSNMNATVTQINYRLPPDCLNVYGVKQSQYPLKLWSEDPSRLDEWVPDPVILGQTGNPEIYCVVEGGWLPDFWGSKAQRSAGFASNNIGTLNFTNNSIFVDEASYSQGNINENVILTANRSTAALVLATNTTQGQFIRMTGDPRWYRTQDFRLISGSEPLTALYRIVLEEPFQGTTTTSAEYTIGGSDSGSWLRLYPIPTAQINIDMEYHALPPTLQGANEEFRIPSQLHGIIMDGALFFLYEYMKDERMPAKRADWDAGLVRVMKAQNMSQEKRDVFRAVPSFERPYFDQVGIFPQRIDG